MSHHSFMLYCEAILLYNGMLCVAVQSKTMWHHHILCYITLWCTSCHVILLWTAVCKAMLPCYATEHSDVLDYTNVLLYHNPVQCRVTLCYVLQCDSIQFMLLLQYTVTCNAVLLCFMFFYVMLFVLCVSCWRMLHYVNKQKGGFGLVLIKMDRCVCLVLLTHKTI